MPCCVCQIAFGSGAAECVSWRVSIYWLVSPVLFLPPNELHAKLYPPNFYLDSSLLESIVWESFMVANFVAAFGSAFVVNFFDIIRRSECKWPTSSLCLIWSWSWSERPEPDFRSFWLLLTTFCACGGCFDEYFGCFGELFFAAQWVSLPFSSLLNLGLGQSDHGQLLIFLSLFLHVGAASTKILAASGNFSSPLSM